MSSNFNFFLNRQGVEGKRGPKGEQGFSPVISVNTNTVSEYTLKIENEDTTFITPNLRGNALENTGGTYVRYNPETSQMYVGGADIASTLQIGEVQIATYQDLVDGDAEDLVTCAKDVNEFVASSISTALEDYVDTTTYNTKIGELEGDISDLSSNKLDKSTYNSYIAATAETLNGLATDKLDIEDLSDYLIAGSNITLSVDSETNEITINANVPSFTQVQADWNQDDSTAVDFIKNKPTIPTVNNAMLTITQGGVLRGTFTANASSDVTIDLDAGGGSDLTAGNGINIDSSNNIDILQSDISNYTWSDYNLYSGSVTDGVLRGAINFGDFGATPVTSGFEYHLDFTTGSTLDVNYWLATYSSPSTPNSGIGVSISEGWPNGSVLSLSIGIRSGGSSVCQLALNTPYSLSTNTHYTIHIDLTPTSYSGYIINNDSGVKTILDLYELSGSYTLTGYYQDIYWGYRGSGYSVWNGTINLDKSYIKVNGNLISNITLDQTTSKEVAKATQDLYGLVKPDGSTTTISNGVISSVAPSNMQTTNNLVTSISSSSTDAQYPSAKLLYDTVGDIETILNNINSGSGGQS